MEFTRTFGAHSTASDLVSESTPALAAPYAAVPGEGRSALTEEMLTIEPPDSCRCMTALAAWATTSGACRFRPSTLSWNRGEASAARAYGAPPALLTSTSSLPWRATTRSTTEATASGSRTSHCSCVVPATGSAAERAQVTTSALASTSTSVIPRPMPRAPPVTRATLPARSTESDMLVEYQANAWFGARATDRPLRGSSMPITSELRDDGIRVVTMDHPPVNALPVQGWFDLAAALDEAGRDLATKVVVLRAEGKGWNAGVDIKEMQHTEGFDALLGANRGCFAAFRAVYECAVPVIAAVNGFCVGGGVGLAGNADIVVASDDAYFGVPEVKQGALGAATHLARLVPQHLMRTLYFTARTIKAAELVQHGSVFEVVPREELDAAALRLAADIADKDTRVIRAAKEALNGIDPVDVNKSYRFEQGFTYELNLMGVSDELRDRFVNRQSVGTDKAQT